MFQGFSLQVHQNFLHIFRIQVNGETLAVNAFCALEGRRFLKSSKNGKVWFQMRFFRHLHAF